jgi:putative nucleotidyltransferase with HDIG domain
MPMHTPAPERVELSEVTDATVGQARELAKRILAGLPDRWRHTVAVARRAEELSAAVDPGDRKLLTAAAWLHDVGYASDIAATGFHPLDGARFLDRHGWSSRLSALVAHHSGAHFVARTVGLDHWLGRYTDEHSAVTDALAYADQTVGAHGERLTINERHADMLRRHGPHSPNAAVHPIRARHLRAAAQRVEERLRAGQRSPGHRLQTDRVGLHQTRPDAADAR